MSAAEPTLPAHRVALRAAVCSVAGSLAAGLVALLLVPLSGDREAGLVMLLWTGGGAVLAGCFVVAVQLARRLPAATRLVALLLAGALTPAVAMCALLWCYELANGNGPEAAWGRILHLLHQLASRPDRSLPGAVAVLIPFALAGAAHAGGLPGALGRDLRLPARVALAAATGAVGCAVAWLAYPPHGSDRILILSFVLLPPTLEVAVALALHGEARLLARFARWRAAGEHE